MTTYTPLGAHLTGDGCEFRLWAPRAERVELALFNDDDSQRNVDMSPIDKEHSRWFVFVPGIVAGQEYGYRVHGAWNPSEGLRHNPAKLLVDPYARAITGGVDYSGPIFDHTAASYDEPDTRDSAAFVPHSVVVEPSPAPRPIAQRRPLSECVIYETHLKGFTQQHPDVPEHLRGTYLGLAYPNVIDHLIATGINTIELLPIHHFVSEPFNIRRGVTNYWGYNTLGYFAPHASYASVGTLGEQVEEFKEMVSALHDAGIEVILDVVYNHTCEGSHEGPTLSFRGIDHRGYYRLTADQRLDYDVTACGNSVDTSHSDVLDLVIDSLRYWVTDMGVDGFRFDLATTLIRDYRHHVDHNHEFKRRLREDPAFTGIKFIAEPWDIGPYGYQVGAWGQGWSEWNDRYRNTIRDYWRACSGGVREVADRLAGSSMIFSGSGRSPEASINFVTAHDGFTLRDLVTYNVKHNDANGEGNRDGSSDNRSWNCGVEGESDDPTVIALRHRQIRNFMATLLLSHGVPMMTAGDEIGHTQNGNNNAYCQDSPLSWMQWSELTQWADVLDLTRDALRLRAEHSLFRPEVYLRGEDVLDSNGHPTGRKDLAWFNEYSGLMTDHDWADNGRTMLGMYLSNADEAYLVWYYSGANPLPVKLPGQPWAQGYHLELTTARQEEFPTQDFTAGQTFTMPPRCVAVLRVDLPGTPLEEA